MGTKTIRAAIAAMCVATAFSPAYAEAKEATLKTTYSGSAINDGFQMLVKLSDNDAYGFSYTDAGGSTATNIWFTSADDTTVYPHEIDKWDTAGDSFVWVLLPELASGTTFKMHWSDSSGDVRSSSGNVWDGYVGVWHMNETGTTAEPDSTGNNLSAVPMNDGGTAININSTTGQIGSGRSFATYFNRMKVEGHKNKLTSQSVFTIGGWVCRSSTSQTHPRIFVGNPTNSDRSKWEVFALSDKSYKVTARGGSNEITFDSIQVGSGTWYYLVVVFDGQTATAYCNGTGYPGAIGNSSQGDYFTIGGVKVNKTASGDSRAFLGTFDEVRMYNGVLSAERIAADYATMNAPTEFLVPASQPTATWTGAAGDGNPATASNWNYYEGSETPIAKVPDSETIVTIAGNSVNLQIPANSTFACKSFEIGSCTFTADCDWRGLSVTPTIVGTADLNGHVLTLNNLSAAAGSMFSNSDSGMAYIRFPADASQYSSGLDERQFVDGIANLSLGTNVRIQVLKNSDGTVTGAVGFGQSGKNAQYFQTGGDVTASDLNIGMNGSRGEFIITNGTFKTTGGGNVFLGANGGIGVIDVGGDAVVTLAGWINAGSQFVAYTASHGEVYVRDRGKLIVNGNFNSRSISLGENSNWNRSGKMEQSGGEVYCAQWLVVGNGNTGSYKQTGGNVSAVDLRVSNNGGTGTYVMDDGTINLRNGWERIGVKGPGTFTQNGGTNNVGNLYLGEDANAVGTFNQTGGEINAGGNMNLGVNNQTAKGVFKQTGGTINVTSPIYLGNTGIGSVDVGGIVNARGGVFVGQNATGSGTLVLNEGGVLNTPFVRRGAGSATVVFDGGTLVATNVTDGANFITGLNNVTYGPGGLTLDTAGTNVTMATASGANVVTSDASTFTKTGIGTLTVAAVPPVGNMVVSNGTLALSASCDNTAPVGIAHRWSFTGDLTDSVTGMAGVTNGSGIATFEDGVVKLPGGTKGTCYIDLGANKLPSDSVTIEAWFTLRSQVDWTRVFVIGGSSGHPTVFNSRRSSSEGGNACNFDSLNGTQIVTGGDKVLAKDVQYYVAVTYTPDGNGGVIEKQYVKKVGDSGFIWNNTVTKANWSVTANAAQGYFWLGHSNGDNPDTKIDFDEVRVWSGALGETAIALSVEKGADATAADIADIAANVGNAVALRAIDIASGATLSIGAGNTLVQPVVKGSGMVSGGTLVVSDKILVTCGETLMASGTINLTNAKVELVDPDNLTTGFYFIKAAPGATLSIVGKPEAVNLPNGWQISVTSSGAKIQKVGFTVILR